MAERNDDRNQTPNQPQPPDQPRALGASAGATAPPNTTDAQQLKAQRGGPQEDQTAGETDRGAHNQKRENRNPSGSEPDRNQSARQEGNDV